MPLFYSPQLTSSSKKFVIEGDEFKHIVKSRRKKIGDEINFTNGKGILFLGKITNITNSELIIKILSGKKIKKSKPKITLAFSLLKKNNRLIIEKCTELGIWEFYPFVSERTVKKNYSEKFRSKLQRVAMAAMKQSGSVYLPSVNSTLNYKELFSAIKKNYRPVLAWEDNKSHFLQEALNSIKSDICLIIGPEGGFTQDEIDYSKTFSTKIVSLGKHILRSETAAITSSANTIFFQQANNKDYY